MLHLMYCPKSKFMPLSTLVLDKSVSSEVRSILSPLPMQRTLQPALPTFERRPKWKGKSKAQVPKGRKPSVTFQKKLVVVDYMGHDPPKCFGLKESYVFMRGMLPEISVDAEETTVRGFVRDTLKNSEKSLRACSAIDFEFLEATGKRLCVPAHQADFQWTGQAIKQLAGTGALYM